MGKIIKKRIEYGGSSNSAENIKYDDAKNVKQAIDEVKSDIAMTNSNLDLDFSNASENVQNVKRYCKIYWIGFIRMLLVQFSMDFQD